MNDFDMKVRIDQQRETIGRLTEEVDGYRERIAGLEAENERLNDEAYSNELAMDGLRIATNSWLYRAERAEAALREIDAVQQYALKDGKLKAILPDETDEFFYSKQNVVFYVTDVQDVMKKHRGKSDG